MRRLFAGIGQLLLMCWICTLQPIQAQTGAVATQSRGPFGYDVAEEVTLEGMVAGFVAKAAQGSIPGAHFSLATLSGPIDVSLGVLALQGRSALSAVVVGQQVEVTGITKTLKNKEVFLARSVKIGEHLYVIRNEHGIPVSPQARERASQKVRQNEESR